MDERRGQTSASNAAQDLACPGRHLAQRDIPEPPRSSDAAWGDAIHAALAAIPNPTSLEVLQSTEQYKALEPKQQEIAESCLKIELEKVREFFGGNVLEMDKAVSLCIREKRFWLKLNDKISHSGQADVVYRVGTRALIIDYKSLAKEKPESAENLQLRDLVCLIAGHFIIVNQVGCVIVQPLSTHSPTPCAYEKEDIARSTQEMYRRILASNDSTSPRIPGEVQCEHGRAKMTCAEHAAFAGYAVPMPSTARPDLWKVAVQDWTVEQRVSFLDNASTAEKWIEDIRKWLKGEVEKDPNFVPGYGLKPNSPLCPVNDPQELFNRIVTLAKAKDEAIDSDEVLADFMRCVKTTKKDVEVMVSKLTGLKGKKLADECKRLFAGITSEVAKADSLKKI